MLAEADAQSSVGFDDTLALDVADAVAEALLDADADARFCGSRWQWEWEQWDS